MRSEQTRDALAGQRRCAEAVHTWETRFATSIGFTVVFAILTAFLQSFIAMIGGFLFLALAWCSVKRAHEWTNMRDSWAEILDDREEWR